MTVVVLAAGYGTRMYPLTENQPKALLPVGGRPILERLEQKLADPQVGVKEAVLVSNHRFAETFRQWASHRSQLAWTVLDDGSTSDKDRLGSMGDLAFAIRSAKLEQKEVLVLGSDNLFEDSLAGFMEFARKKQAVTLGAVELPDRRLASLYGVLTVDPAQRITAFTEKPAQPISALVSTAVYFFPRTALGLVLEYVASQTKADRLGSFISWLVDREPAFAYRFREAWVDIGDMDSYNKAQETFSS